MDVPVAGKGVVMIYVAARISYDIPTAHADNKLIQQVRCSVVSVAEKPVFGYGTDGTEPHHNYTSFNVTHQR